MVRYVSTRVPEDVYKQLYAKKLRLEKVGEEMLGKPVSIPLTKVMRMVVNKQTYIPDDEILQLLRKGGRKRR